LGRLKGIPNLKVTKSGNLINRYGLRITPEEKKYIKSLTQSINRKRKQILEELAPHQKPTYMKHKSQTAFAPKKVSALQQMQLFTSRAKMFRKVEELEKQRRDLIGNARVLPSAKVETFSKRLKKIATTTQPKTITPKMPKLKSKQTKFSRSNLYMSKKAEIYKKNMKEAISKVDAITNKQDLYKILDDLTEEEFILYITENPVLNIQYIYHDPNNNRGIHLHNELQQYIGRQM